MTFGENRAITREKKGLSQEELAKLVGIIGVNTGRYEIDEIKPCIDIATKLSDALDVSLDYLVGSFNSLLEKSLVKKITDIQNLSIDQNNIVVALMDAFLRDFKTRQAYAH